MPTPTTTKEAIRGHVNGAYKVEWGRSVAFLMRLARDLHIAEDCVQDAFESALVYWARDGVPDNPGAWIRTAAKNRFIDGARSSRSRRNVLDRLGHLERPAVQGPDIEDMDRSIKDDELALIFLCCHPAIAVTDQVMLTLRTVAGLRPKEIATAFFAHDEAVRTRLLRAKRKIRGARIPISLPQAEQLEARISQVLAVIFLIFNEGYLASRGEDARRSDLVTEAMRLSSRLVELVPNNSEAHGLRALLLFTDARTPARLPEPDVLVPLEEQDRTLWNQALISGGFKHLDHAFRKDTPGRYALQAAIAAEHSKASSHAGTDWSAIVVLYDHLLEIENSTIYRLNRCVAVSFADSPLSALDELGKLEHEGALENHYLLSATRGDFLRKAGRKNESLTAYKAAAAQVENAAVRKFLHRRVHELEVDDS